MSKDYYNILGVNKNASKDEIKRAYRRLAHQYHPDKNSGDDKKFKEINEAYQVLGNDQKRQQYDQFGDFFSSFGQQGFGGQSQFYGRRINLEDLFSDIFDVFGGAGFYRTRPRSRKNIVVDMNVDLEDVIKGIEKEIRLEDLNIKLNIKPKASRKTIKEIKKLLKKMKK